MQLTIIRADNQVYIDGVCRTVDCSALPANVHAVQWNGVTGWIEYTDQGNEPLLGIAAYSALIEAWTALGDPSDLQAYAARRRWEKEAGGITVGGAPVATDDRSKQMIIGARLAALADPNFETQWKVGPGAFVMLGAAQLIAISDAVAAHVAACFAAEAEVSAGIAAETITTLAQIDAVFDAIVTAY